MVILMIVASYFINLGALLGNSPEWFNFLFSVGYLIVWSMLIKSSARALAKEPVIHATVFWAASSVYYLIHVIGIIVTKGGTGYDLNVAIGMILFLLVPLFLLPMIGFIWPVEILETLISFGEVYFWFWWYFPLLLLSALMLLVCILVLKRIKKTGADMSSMESSLEKRDI